VVWGSESEGVEGPEEVAVSRWIWRFVRGRESEIVSVVAGGHGGVFSRLNTLFRGRGRMELGYAIRRVKRALGGEREDGLLGCGVKMGVIIPVGETRI